MKKVIIAVTIALLSAVGAYAFSDNGTEFGIEDDLSVLGSTGTWVDPDVEIKGFSIFGPVTGPQNIAASSGNVVIRGNLQADATAYFGSSVTVAGYATLQSTVTMTEGNMKYGTGASGKVMKSGGDGFVYWGDDNVGSVSGTPYRIAMFNAGGNSIVDSPLINDGGGASVSVMGSSLTVKSDFGVDGAVKLGNALTDTVDVAGVATVQDSLTVNGNSQLGNATSDIHGVNRAAEANVGLAVDATNNPGDYVVKFYSGGSLAGWIKHK